MLRAVDDFHFTKPHLAALFQSAVRPDAQAMLPLYSAREVAEPSAVDPEIGVSFVGHHSPGKEHALRAFLSRYEGRVTVVGDGWGPLALAAKAGAVQQQPALYGGVVQRIYQRSVCTLGLLMEGRPGGWGGDELTSRTVLVPASGGVLLHPRTATAEALYGPDCPVLYNSIDEAAEMARHLARDPERRLVCAHGQRLRVLELAPSAEAMVERWVA